VVSGRNGSMLGEEAKKMSRSLSLVTNGYLFTGRSRVSGDESSRFKFDDIVD